MEYIANEWPFLTLWLKFKTLDLLGTAFLLGVVFVGVVTYKAVTGGRHE